MMEVEVNSASVSETIVDATVLGRQADPVGEAIPVAQRLAAGCRLGVVALLLILGGIAWSKTSWMPILGLLDMSELGNVDIFSVQLALGPSAIDCVIRFVLVAPTVAYLCVEGVCSAGDFMGRPWAARVRGSMVYSVVMIASILTTTPTLFFGTTHVAYVHGMLGLVADPVGGSDWFGVLFLGILVAWFAAGPAFVVALMLNFDRISGKGITEPLQYMIESNKKARQKSGINSLARCMVVPFTFVRLLPTMVIGAIAALGLLALVFYMGAIFVVLPVMMAIMLLVALLAATSRD